MRGEEVEKVRRTAFCLQRTAGGENGKEIL